MKVFARHDGALHQVLPVDPPIQCGMVDARHISSGGSGIELIKILYCCVSVGIDF